MASPASQDAPTYDLQPHPTSPSLTFSSFILVLPVAHSPSTTHHTTILTLPNVPHIARYIMPQLITTPATLSIRPGVIPRVSVADHCSIVPCIAKTFPMRRGIRKVVGVHARRLLKVRGFASRIFECVITWVSHGHGGYGIRLGKPRVPKGDSFGFWGPNDTGNTGFAPGTPGSPGEFF